MRPRPEDRQRVTGSTLGQQSRRDDHFSSGRQVFRVRSNRIDLQHLDQRRAGGRLPLGKLLGVGRRA